MAVGGGDDLIELTVAQAADGIRTGELSADEYFDAYREAAAGDSLNAFLWTADEPEEAGEGSLGGIPVAIKDIFCTQGIPTTAGSRILEGYRPPYTATAVRKLREAGARVLGKANMDEFAMGSSNENSGYGPVLNPWDPGRVPGGSSGGSAAAVAGRLAPCAIGTDTGGSIRQPAALCGIVGMKPTYGAVSRYGMIAFASSLDQCGPLTRDVTDAALVLQAVEGRDPCDSTSLGIEGGVETAEPRGPEGPQLRHPEGARLRGRGDRVRGQGGLRAHRRPDRGARRRGLRNRAAACASRHLGLLRARPGGGLGEPGPLRRCPLRHASRCRGPHRDVRGDARQGLRRRGEAADHARHLRALLGLLRGLLRPRPAGPHQDRRGLLEGLRALRLRRHARPRRRSPSSSERRPTTRWRCT